MNYEFLYLSFIAFISPIDDTISGMDGEAKLERLLGHLRTGITAVGPDDGATEVGARVMREVETAA